MKKRNLLLLFSINLFSLNKGYVYNSKKRLITTFLYNNINDNNIDKNMKYSYFQNRYISKKKNNNNNDNNNEKYISNVMYEWVKQFVFGLNLCPFSGSILVDNKMNIKVMNDDDDSKGLSNIFDYIINESKLISKSNKDSKYTTTLLVLSSSSWSDYHNYLQLVEDVEDLLASTKLDEYIQIASFHPFYIFADTDENSVENWTNRSPYPCLHLLKVDDVSKAINSYGNTQNIYENNIKKMHTLGIEKIKKINEDIKKLK